MSRLTPLSWQELVARLREFGFEGPHGGGRHLFMIKDNLRFTLPNPHRREIGVELLSRLLKQAGISRDDWVG